MLFRARLSSFYASAENPAAAMHRLLMTLKENYPELETYFTNVDEMKLKELR